MARSPCLLALFTYDPGRYDMSQWHVIGLFAWAPNPLNVRKCVLSVRGEKMCNGLESDQGRHPISPSVLVLRCGRQLVDRLRSSPSGPTSRLWGGASFGHGP